MSIKEPGRDGAPRTRGKTIVILASRFDQVAERLAERWSQNGALLLRPSDLSVQGWRDMIPSSIETQRTAVVSGRVISFDEVGAVLVRLPRVLEQELDLVALPDRAYVASEMSSYLLSWLSRLRCPMLNHPTTASLSGPGWRPEIWVRAAARLGIRVDTVRRSSMTSGGRRSPPESLTTVSVVGDATIGEASASEAESSLRLARYAGVGMMQAVYRDSVLVNATDMPSLGSETLSAAVLQYLLDGR